MTGFNVYLVDFIHFLAWLGSRQVTVFTPSVKVFTPIVLFYIYQGTTIVSVVYAIDVILCNRPTQNKV